MRSILSVSALIIDTAALACSGVAADDTTVDGGRGTAPVPDARAFVDTVVSADGAAVDDECAGIVDGTAVIDVGTGDASAIVAAAVVDGQFTAFDDFQHMALASRTGQASVQRMAVQINGNGYVAVAAHCQL